MWNLINDRVVVIPAEYLPSIDELPGELPRIAEVVEASYPGMGVPIAILLAQAYPGQSIYLHSVQSIKRNIRDDAIRSRYDKGIKVKELATDTGLSTRQIERILAQASCGRQEELKEKQMRLF